jgi:N-acetylglucosamine malate deacetylase 1
MTATFEVKAQALAAHGGTQPITGQFGPMAETLARLWGARIGARYAEAFTPIPVLGRLPATARTTPARRNPPCPSPRRSISTAR